MYGLNEKAQTHRKYAQDKINDQLHGARSDARQKAGRGHALARCPLAKLHDAQHDRRDENQLERIEQKPHQTADQRGNGNTRAGKLGNGISSGIGHGRASLLFLSIAIICKKEKMPPNPGLHHFFGQGIIENVVW